MVSWRLIRISPLPSVRMRSGRRHVLRIRLAVATEPTRGFQALFKRCEAAVCATFPAVIRAPRIVLGFGWSVEHSCCSNNAERKQNQSHQSPHISRVADGLTLKTSASRNLDLSQNRSIVWPLAASRRRSPSRTVSNGRKLGT